MFNSHENNIVKLQYLVQIINSPSLLNLINIYLIKPNFSN